MSSRKAIQNLVDIVCKGGTLLLNIAPGSDGTWQDDAYNLLNKMGNWLKINREVIFKTRLLLLIRTHQLLIQEKRIPILYM